MRQSESIVDLAAALVKAQAKIEGAVKASENTHFRNKYADLGAVWDAIREPLTSNGLAVVQLLRGVERGVECETILMHSGGQFIAETLFMPAGKNDAQGFGSAATYARRYGLQAMVGIAPVDDDGEGARDKSNGHDERREPPSAKPGSAMRGTPIADARREIDAGTASTAPQNGGATKLPTLKADPKAWVASKAATDFIGKARDELNVVKTYEEYSAWERDHRDELDAFDEHGADVSAGRSGMSRKAFMRNLLDGTYDRVRAATPDLRAAG